MQDDDDGMSAPAAKRVGPADVPPLVLGAVRYEVIHWGGERELAQNGGYIAAVDASSNMELWTLKIYDVSYDPVMEEDVQDIFLHSMTARGPETLHVVDERGRAYLVDTTNRRAKLA